MKKNILKYQEGEHFDIPQIAGESYTRKEKAKNDAKDDAYFNNRALLFYSDDQSKNSANKAYDRVFDRLHNKYIKRKNKLQKFGDLYPGKAREAIANGDIPESYFYNDPYREEILGPFHSSEVDSRTGQEQAVRDEYVDNLYNSYKHDPIAFGYHFGGSQFRGKVSPNYTLKGYSPDKEWNKKAEEARSNIVKYYNSPEYRINKRFYDMMNNFAWTAALSSVAGQRWIPEALAGEAVNLWVNAATDGEKDSWGELIYGGDNPAGRFAAEATNPAYLKSLNGLRSFRRPKRINTANLLKETSSNVRKYGTPNPSMWRQAQYAGAKYGLPLTVGYLGGEAVNNTVYNASDGKHETFGEFIDPTNTEVGSFIGDFFNPGYNIGGGLIRTADNTASLGNHLLKKAYKWLGSKFNTPKYTNSDFPRLLPRGYADNVVAHPLSPIFGPNSDGQIINGASTEIVIPAVRQTTKKLQYIPKSVRNAELYSDFSYLRMLNDSDKGRLYGLNNNDLARLNRLYKQIDRNGNLGLYTGPDGSLQLKNITGNRMLDIPDPQDEVISLIDKVSGEEASGIGRYLQWKKLMNSNRFEDIVRAEDILSGRKEWDERTRAWFIIDMKDLVEKSKSKYYHKLYNYPMRFKLLPTSSRVTRKYGHTSHSNISPLERFGLPKHERYLTLKRESENRGSGQPVNVSDFLGFRAINWDQGDFYSLPKPTGKGFTHPYSYYVDDELVGPHTVYHHPQVHMSIGKPVGNHMGRRNEGVNMYIDNMSNWIRSNKAVLNLDPQDTYISGGNIPNTSILITSYPQSAATAKMSGIPNENIVFVKSKITGNEDPYEKHTGWIFPQKHKPIDELYEKLGFKSYNSVTIKNPGEKHYTKILETSPKTHSQSHTGFDFHPGFMTGMWEYIPRSAKEGYLRELELRIARQKSRKFRDIRGNVKHSSGQWLINDINNGFEKRPETDLDLLEKYLKILDHESVYYGKPLKTLK